MKKTIKTKVSKPKKLPKYLRDEEGFVEVEFRDSDDSVVEYVEPKDDSLGFEVPEEQRKFADEGKITQKMLLDMDTTSMLRLATYEPAGKQIMELIGFRGLPLKEPYSLRAHQMQTLTWMRFRENMDPSKVFGLRGGIAMLTQGLGKTLTALSLILTSPKGEFPSLVVASKTVMYEWRSEGVKKFFGNNVKVLYLHNDFMGKKNVDQITRKDILEYEIIITTYDVLVSACRKFPYHQQTYEIGEDNTMQKGKKVAIHHRSREQCNRPNTKGIGILFCTPWERVICDESQKFANPKTTIYECVMALYGEKMWCLSGTPIRNYCFTGDTRVVTNEGNISIRNLVRYEQNRGLRILSYNSVTDKFEYKKLQNGWELEAKNGLVTITMGKKKIKCTPDHKILVVKNSLEKPFYVEAQNLQLGSYIVHYGDKDARTCAMNILNPDQEQVVIGSYLGDGHLRVLEYYRTSLRVTHSEKQRDYAKWKADIFQVSITEKDQTAPGYADKKVYSFDTTSFYFPYEDIQSNKKTVPQNIIDKIDDLALLIWYLDDGFINEAGNMIELATCSFDEDTNVRLCAKLCSIGVQCRVSQKYSKKQEKYYSMITLSVTGTKELISRIYKFEIPECMRYKIDCQPLLRQIEDSERPLKDVFWNKHHIPMEKRYDGMIVKESTAGGKKVGIFKWLTCSKCNETSFLCKRTDSKNLYRCMMCRSQSTGVHMDRTLFKITNESYTPSDKFLKSFQIHPVTQIHFDKNPKDKKVFDIQVEDNHNFVIGSINDDVKYGPVVSNCTDIWAQFRFCGYTGVTMTQEWKRSSMAKYHQHGLNDAIFSMDYKDAKIELPPRTEYVDLVELTGNHKIFYEWVLGQTRLAYDDMMKGYLDFACVLAWFTALRQTAIAPYLFTANSKRNKATGKAKKHKEEMMTKIKNQFANSEMFKWLTDKTTDSGINSAKIKEIVKIISRIPKGDKVLVFSMFTSCTDLLGDACTALLPDFKYVQVDGDVVGKDRATLLEKFKKDPDVQGLFMTYKVGSEGLNLTQATHCICIEPWWTDAVHRQAKARCWRMGQTREVHVHNVYVQNTIEEKVTDICKAKNEMADSFLEGTEKPLKKNVGLDKFTLGKILGIN